MNISNPYEGERRPGTVGMPLPGVEVSFDGGGEEGESSSADRMFSPATTETGGPGRVLHRRTVGSAPGTSADARPTATSRSSVARRSSSSPAATTSTRARSRRCSSSTRPSPRRWWSAVPRRSGVRWRRHSSCPRSRAPPAEPTHRLVDTARPLQEAPRVPLLESVPRNALGKVDDIDSSPGSSRPTTTARRSRTISTQRINAKLVRRRPPLRVLLEGISLSTQGPVRSAQASR